MRPAFAGRAQLSQTRQPTGLHRHRGDARTYVPSPHSHCITTNCNIFPPHTAVPERDLYATFESCGPIEFVWNYDQATVATITFERPEAMMKALKVKELSTKVQIIVREYVESER